MATNTDELETAIQSGYVDNIQKCRAERILREREKEPDKKLARRTYNDANWARAYSVIVALNCCIIALIILWLGQTSGRAPRQPAEAAEPETSLLAAPPIETAKPETSSLDVPPIAAPQEAPAPPTEAAEPETSPPAAPADKVGNSVWVAWRGNLADLVGIIRIFSFSFSCAPPPYLYS